MTPTDRTQALRTALRCSEAAAEALLHAGHDDESPAIHRLKALALDNADDVRLALEHLDDWTPWGWYSHEPHTYRTQWPPSEALRLHAAGLTHRDALARRRAGYDTVDDILAAEPPAIPDTPGRIYLTVTSDEALLRGPYIAADPAAMREWAAAHPEVWRGHVAVEPGVRARHAVDDWDVHWSLWSDGALIADASWIGDRPEKLGEAAAAAITIIATADNDSAREHYIREVCETVTRVDTAVVERDEWYPDPGVAVGRSLTRITLTTPNRTHELWRVTRWTGSGTDFNERHTVWPREHPARVAYAEADA